MLCRPKGIQRRLTCRVHHTIVCTYNLDQAIPKFFDFPPQCRHSNDSTHSVLAISLCMSLKTKKIAKLLENKNYSRMTHVCLPPHYSLQQKCRSFIREHKQDRETDTDTHTDATEHITTRIRGWYQAFSHTANRLLCLVLFADSVVEMSARMLVILVAVLVCLPHGSTAKRCFSDSVVCQKACTGCSTPCTQIVYGADDDADIYCCDC